MGPLSFLGKFGGLYMYLSLTENEHIYSVAMATAQPIPTRPIPENMFLGVLNVCARIQLPKSILREKVISPCQKVHF